LQAWAEEHGMNAEELELESEDLGVRITYFAGEHGS